MTVEYTRKGLTKAEEWANLKSDAAKKMIRRAAVWGQDITELPSKQKAYFESYVDTSRRKAVVYSGYCFVFADDYCVNMLRVPKWFGKKSNYVGKTQIKNPKKYSKHYDVEEAWAYA